MNEAIRVLSQLLDYITQEKPHWGDNLRPGIEASIDLLDEGEISPTEIKEILKEW